MTFFKVLDGYQPTNGGSGRYPGVRRWTRHLNPDTLVACQVGYHIVKDAQILDWLGPTVYEAEPCDQHPPVDDSDKWVTCRVRLTQKLNWSDRTARLFAADCAKAALLGERASGREPDERSWTVIEVATRFAEGDATADELAAAWDAARAAARAAAWDAAGAAAWAAARDAAGAAQFVRLEAYLYDRPIPPVEALYGATG